MSYDVPAPEDLRTRGPLDGPLYARAVTAYFRYGGQARLSSAHSGLVTQDETRYVVLGTGEGIAAVYHVTPAGGVRRLRQWPGTLPWGPS